MVSKNLIYELSEFIVPRSVLISVLWLFVSVRSVSALDPSRHLSQYGHSAWRLQDGTFPGRPEAITQTKDGYIWVGTQDGLLRFDGVRFVPWQPPAGRELPSSSSTIVSLLGARDGSLWIGTITGLSHWSNGELTNYPSPLARFNSILEGRNGTIWVTRSKIRDWSGPLCRVVGSDLRCYGTADGIPANAADPIIEDSQGDLWVGTSGVLIRWREKLAGLYPLKGATASDDMRIINGVVMTQDDTLLVGVTNVGPGLGLQQFAHNQWKPFAKPGLNGSALEVRTMFLDRDQSIWVGTTNQGIYRIHGEVVDHFGRADGLSGDSVQKFLQDREGNVWITTSDGLDVFRDLRVANFTVREGLTSGYTGSVAVRRDGSVWSGNLGGLDFLAMGQTSFNGIRKNLRGRMVRAVFEDRTGNLWVGIDHGIYVYNRGRFKPVLNPIRAADKTRSVSSLAEDSNGNIWAVLVGTNPTLLRIHDFQVREEIPTSTIPAAFGVAPDPQDGIWANLLNGDLARYHQGAWQRISLGPVSPAGYHGHSLFNIFIDSAGTVWGAAGGGGLAAYRDGKLKLLTEQNGLPCNFTYSLAMDLHAALWVFSQCGLTRISSSELQRFWEHPDAKIKVEHFGRLDGVQTGVPPFHPGVARSSDGRLWFSNGIGLQMIDPDRFVTNTDAPPVHIEQLVADKKNYPLLNQATLPALTRDIEIDYTALSFVLPQRVSFRYILEGRDITWQDPGTRRQAFYSDLRPGSYRFRVIASNNDGVWNNEGATLDFSIAPAFYQTVSFKALTIAAGLCGLYLLYLLRLKQVTRQVRVRLAERFDERERIARDLHDTLLQSVQGLILKFHALARQVSAGDVRQSMESALDHADQVLAEGRDRVRSLRGADDALTDLAAAFQRVAGQDSPERAANVKVVVEGSMRPLNPMVQEESFYIGREALTNALRHSGGLHVEVEIAYEPKQFRLRVRDDGCGLDSSIREQGGRPGHWGLPGMRERAERIGARLQLWSGPKAGTEVELTVPGATAYRPVRPKLRKFWSGRISRIGH